MSNALLPLQLRANVSNENQEARVESVILPPVQHDFNAGGRGTSRFRLLNKGVLDSRSSLEFSVRWAGDPGNDSNGQVLAQRLSGCLPVKAARLYINGVLCDELQEAGSYISLIGSLNKHSHKVGVMDIKRGSNVSYTIGRNGGYKLDDLPRPNQVGSKVIKTGRAPQYSVLLQDIFGMLKDVQLPLDAQNGLGQVVIEIDWETNGDNVLSLANQVGEIHGALGAVTPGVGNYKPGELCDATGGTGRNAVFKVTTDAAAAAAPVAAVTLVSGGHGYTNGDTVTLHGRESGANTCTVVATTASTAPTRTLDIPKDECNLILDYIHYPDEVRGAINQAMDNLSFVYRNKTLVKKQVPEVAGAGTKQSTDILLGFQNRFIQRVLVQKLSTAITSNDAGLPIKDVLLDQRSDLQNEEEIQLIINNKPLIDQKITNDAFAYSLLNQTFDEGELTIPSGAYDEEYTVAAGDTDNTLSLSNEDAAGGGRGGVNFQQVASGSQSWKALPLTKSLGMEINPANATRSGASAMILRYGRTGVQNPSKQATVGGAYVGIAPINVRVWVETISQCSVRDGKVTVVNL
ncbi:MAG: hypothetical protein ACR2M9_04145 [Cyanophyceae cyanobacterium]